MIKGQLPQRRTLRPPPSYTTRMRRCAQQVLATEAGIQVDHPPVGSFCRLLGRTMHMLRAVVRVSRPPPSPPSSPYKNKNPASLNDDLVYRHHLNLVRQAHPSLSSVWNWLEEGDVHMAGVFPTSAGSFANIWRGSLDNRQVAIKSCRCYLTVDPTQIFLVG